VFTDSGHIVAPLRTGAWGHKRPPASQQVALLFDNLVGGGKERWRHVEADRFGGLEIDESQTCWDTGLDRQVAWFLAL
jgi:hypothetical protein